MDAYHVLERIGEGSFGKVYKGRRKYTGQFVALKFISKANKTEADLAALRKEISILRQLDHENIILLLDYFETARDVVVVTEYAHGELLQILRDDGALPESTVRSIGLQLARALHYLHSHRIMHRDMKPQNVLVGSNGIIKLADFGFAREMSASTIMLTSIKGTPLYMAPEMLLDKQYDWRADVWGLGVMLFELASGIPPFYANNMQALLKMIVASDLDHPVNYPESMSPLLVSFLSMLIVRDPAKRAGWSEIFEHPFLAEPSSQDGSIHHSHSDASGQSAHTAATLGGPGQSQPPQPAAPHR